MIRAKNTAASATEFLRRIGSLEPLVPATSEFDRKNVVARRLPMDAWPEARVHVVAVDADTGARTVFDRRSDVAFADAVTASCAVAGLWPATAINGRRYIDGGFYSIDNADLAAGAERVLILTFPARVPPLCIVSLDAAVDILRQHGSRVEVVHPDGSSPPPEATVNRTAAPLHDYASDDVRGQAVIIETAVN